MSPSVYSGDNSESEEDEDEEDTKSTEKPEETYPVSMLRIIRLNGKEWPYILVGSLGSITMGATLPLFAIIFGEFFGVLELRLTITITLLKFLLFTDYGHQR